MIQRLNDYVMLNRKSKAIQKLVTLLEKLKFESVSEEQLRAIRDQFKLVNINTYPL